VRRERPGRGLRPREGAGGARGRGGCNISQNFYMVKMPKMIEI